MGALGCKYCNCDKEKMEEISEEMKIQYNTPVIITNGNKEKNNENIENYLNKNEDLSLNIEINNAIENSENKSLIKNKPQSSNDSNNHKNNIKKILIENDNNIKVIEETLKGTNLNSANNNNINEHDKNNIMKNSNEEFIIEENNTGKKSNKNQINTLKESKTNQFSINNTKEAKKKIQKFEINKIQFGLEKEDRENLNKEQKKLYNEAENNLQQFSPPQGNEMNQVQTAMSNILIKLKNIFVNIDLNSNRDDQEHILLSGNLQKMINYEINAHNPTMYSERFCVLYPKMLKYYKSQVQFLKNLKPSCVLPINQISAVNIAKPKKKQQKLYHLIICNKLGIKKNVNNSVFLNLFDSCEINDYLASPDLNESLLIFTSDKEQDIYKWYIVIQYLNEYSKKEK